MRAKEIVKRITIDLLQIQNTVGDGNMQVRDLIGILLERLAELRVCESYQIKSIIEKDEVRREEEKNV